MITGDLVIGWEELWSFKGKGRLVQEEVLMGLFMWIKTETIKVDLTIPHLFVVFMVCNLQRIGSKFAECKIDSRQGRGFCVQFTKE